MKLKHEEKCRNNVLELQHL